MSLPLQFRTCIGTLGVNLTEAETQELINRYKTEQPGLINYRSFINSLDQVFSESMNPTAVIEDAKTSAVSYKFRLKMPLSEANLTFSKFK